PSADAIHYSRVTVQTCALPIGEGATAWVDVMLHPAQPTPNQAPVAENDSGFSTVQNTALQISASALLANDTDPNGDPLTITGVSGATNGTVSFDAQTNIVTFTPATGHTGTAGFTYAISDGRGGTASANVALNVTQPTQSLFAANATPAILSDPEAKSVELGMKFTSSVAGSVVGVRFYKGLQ